MYVLPSNWEGFSLTLLEAASHSLPIIISKSIDSEEYRVGGKGLATFDNSNPDGLKGELELVRHDKATRDRMAAVSRALAKKYSEQKMLDSYAKLMLDLTGK